MAVAYRHDYHVEQAPPRREQAPPEIHRNAKGPREDKVADPGQLPLGRLQRSQGYSCRVRPPHSRPALAR
jgi:hypothetical protein